MPKLDRLWWRGCGYGGGGGRWVGGGGREVMVERYTIILNFSKTRQNHFVFQKQLRSFCFSNDVF